MQHNTHAQSTQLSLTRRRTALIAAFAIAAGFAAACSGTDAGSKLMTPTDTAEAARFGFFAPGEAQSVVAKSAGTSSATVTWTAPSSSGASAIQSYTVVSSPDNKSTSVNAQTLTATVSKLTNGRTYTFKVYAQNRYGSSTSASSNAVTIGKADAPAAKAPSAPTGISATAGDASATVTWAAAADSGSSAVSGYTVTSTPGNITVSVAGNVTTTPVSGLTNGTSYTFVVTAKNSAGTSAASAASNAVTPKAAAATAPSAPQTVAATAGNAQATVTWKAPASAGSSAVASYTVTSTPGNLSATVNAMVTTTTVTGLTNGTSYTFVVTAKNTTSTSVASAPSNAVTPTAGSQANAPANQSWAFCVNAGNVCNFLGLRDVRLADPSGAKSVTQTVFHSVPCAVYGFNNQNPAPNSSLHCDISPAKTQTMQNPSPGMAGMPASVIAPLGDPGATGPQSRSAGGSGVFSDFGAFRLTCNLAKFGFDDPIVYPGQPGASHLHMFFGNTGTNANSTPQSMASSGNSTCAGGTLNRTGYWMPAIFDTRSGNVVMPDIITVYYKTGLNMDYTKIQPMPTGLRMIAGDKTWQGPGPQTEKPQGMQFITWSCRDGSVNVSYQDSGNIPNCKVGDAVHLTIDFPQCWDGKNLDSPDHKSHVARATYAGSTRNGSTCPSTHPVILPLVTEIFDFPVTDANAPLTWRLSSDMYDTSKKGGFSAHADWMMGWDEATMKSIVTNCLNKGLDCGVNFIGGGTEIYR